MKGGVPWPISLCKLEAGSALAEIEKRARLDLWPRSVVWPNYCFEFKKAVSFMHRTVSVLKNIKNNVTNVITLSHGNESRKREFLADGEH